MRVFTPIALAFGPNSIDAFSPLFPSHPSSCITTPTRQKIVLRAKPNKSSPGRGFGSSDNSKQPKPLKYTNEKSYGQTTASAMSESELLTAMQNFFSTHNEWHPLFLDILSPDKSPAHSLLTQSMTAPFDIWDLSALSGNRPWKLLPSKPTSESSLSTLSLFLDEWQKSLLEIPMDAFKDVEGGYDLHFLEEGRRTIAVTRFHVLDGDTGRWEEQLFETCWSELGHITSKDDTNGSLILIPDATTSLEQVKEFVQQKLIGPMEWLGRSQDWEIVAMERGAVGVRLLYKLGDIPDLSEKYRAEE